MNDLVFILVSLLAEIVLLFCGAFFAGSETAFTSLSRITVRQMVKDGEKNAGKIYKLKTHLDRLISTVLIGTNLVTTLISSLATALTVRIFGGAAVSLSTAIVSVLVIVFCEIIPKTLAAVRSKQCASFSAPMISIIQLLLFPLVKFFDLISAFLDFFDRTVMKKKKPLVTEEELKTLLTLGRIEGTLEADEKAMLDRIFDYSDLQVHDMMRHRSLVCYVDVSDSVDSVVDVFAKSGYSRLPVIDGNPEKVVGVLHYKSVLFAVPEIKRSPDFVRICMSDVLFVPETFSAVELLRTFKKEHENFAVAVDEYGGTSGIVTMDDILRGVFGRITDEYGTTDVAPEKRVTVLGTKEFIVPGDMKIDDVNDVLKLNLESEVYNTLGGWLLERFDELPPVGAVYKFGSIIFVVEDQSARRIQSVRIVLR